MKQFTNFKSLKSDNPILYKKLTALVYSFVSIHSLSEGYRTSSITSSLSVDQNVFEEIIRTLFVIIETQGYQFKDDSNVLESSQLFDFIEETVRKKNKFNLKFRFRTMDIVYVVIIVCLLGTLFTTNDYTSGVPLEILSFFSIFGIIRLFEISYIINTHKQFEDFSNLKITKEYVSHIKFENNHENRRRLLIDFYLTVDNYFNKIN